MFVTEYEMVAVPEATPETNPNRTVATPLFDELHVPNAVASDNVIVLPTHTDVGPVIGFTDGNAFIDTVLLAEAVQPAALVTVTAYVPLADAVIAAVVAEPPVAFH
jgi:hypothetical protein